MKPPEEIKKGLEGCKDKSNCEWCNLIDQCKRNADALAYIQQLEDAIDNATQLVQSANELIKERLKEMESRLAQVERERDAALKELKAYKWYEGEEEHAEIRL